MQRTILLTVLGLLALPAGALAAAGPVPPALGGSGVTVPGARFAYVAQKDGADTRIEQMRKSDWSVAAAKTVRGRVGIPGVTFDGVNTGLSADGGTLVVAGNPRRAGTRLVVIDTRRLRAPAREIALPGYSTVDEVSPDGRLVYLVHYLSPDPAHLHYEIRAYDLAAGRMLPRPIVDPREPDEKMQGMAITRATSPDGRWAYTLYAGEESFVHALDTVGGRAFCIDVEGDVSQAALTLDGPLLRVGDLAVIDTRTWKVRSPGDEPAAGATPAPEKRSEGGAMLWTLVLVPVAVAGLAFASRRRRRSSPAA